MDSSKLNAPYKTIFLPSEASFKEKKSRFIGAISPCESVDDANAFVAKISRNHREAAHNCFAYSLRAGAVKASDNGEPQGTAGVPILEVLKKEELLDVCIVVTRYFGGILLGNGGLIRAYSKAASLACKSAKVKEMALCSKICLSFEYSYYGKIQNLLPKFSHNILSSDFAQIISLVLSIHTCDEKSLVETVTELCNGQIKIDITSHFLGII